MFDPRERDDRAESDYHDKTAPLTRQLPSESAESRFGILLSIGCVLIKRF